MDKRGVKFFLGRGYEDPGDPPKKVEPHSPTFTKNLTTNLFGINNMQNNVEMRGDRTMLMILKGKGIKAQETHNTGTVPDKENVPIPY